MQQTVIMIIAKALDTCEAFLHTAASVMSGDDAVQGFPKSLDPDVIGIVRHRAHATRPAGYPSVYNVPHDGRFNRRFEH